MFRTRSLIRQPVRLVCYVIVLTVVLAVILSANHQLSGKHGRLHSNPDLDWNVYETIEEEEEDYNKKSHQDIVNCDTIHLATVCGGSNSTREFYVLLKSILFYRTNPIHLHLMLDDIAHRTFVLLFETWQIPDVQVSYYNASKYEHQISWIPTHHYSSQFGLMKLLIPSLLRRDTKLETVIMLDTDMLMLGNIKQLQNQFRLMAKTRSSIGLVEQQSDWYLGRQLDSTSNVGVHERLVWPAIGRGFNTGLLLLNLVELERNDWDQLWREVAERELVTRFSTALADQDILNTVLKLHPYLYTQLPCNFNIQLNERAQLDQTCPDHRDADLHFRLIHWNSPHKLETKNLNADDYLGWYLTFVNWDASLLKRKIWTGGCPNKTDIGLVDISSHNKEPILDTTIEQSCKDIRPRPNDKLRALLFAAEVDQGQRNAATAAADTSQPDVSIAVHLSIDRLRALDELSAHWLGPISASIYMFESETSQLLDSLRNSDQLSWRTNIALTLVFREHGFSYPINRLRNIALGQANGEFVFLIDVDFIPSFNLYKQLRTILAESKTSGEPLQRRAFVVPAFESSKYKLDFPESKSELVRQLNLGSLDMFRAQLWPRGHAPTDYTRWKVVTRSYRVEWRPDYEPFVIVERTTIPRFDEKFVGFGWNKVEHAMQLAAEGYEFWVLPEAFIVHQFHPASYDIVKHRQSQRYRACIRHLKLAFTAELVRRRPKFLSMLRASTVEGISTEMIDYEKPQNEYNISA